MSFAKIRPRRGTASQWSNANPILTEGEIGIEVPSTGVGTGNVKIKFGDGSTHWNDLPYGLDNSNAGGSSSDVISEKFIAGTPCTSGNYYIANDKLYKCIADTDGSINVTNSNYFEETSVADELKALKNTPSTEYKVKEYTFEYPNKNVWMNHDIEESNAFIDCSSYIETNMTNGKRRLPLGFVDKGYGIYGYISYEHGKKQIVFNSQEKTGTVHAFVRYK